MIINEKFGMFVELFITCLVDIIPFSVFLLLWVFTFTILYIVLGSNDLAVKDNFKECDYTGAVNFVIGNVEDTIPTIGLSNIALLRIDVDLAKPTRHVLDNFYSLISTNGHLILDDYGHFPAVKMTVDDYFKDDTIELIEISYTVRRMVK